MRNVNHHLLEDKMDEEVTHYITHQTGDSVHVDANSLALNIQDEGGRVVVMHPQSFTQQMCRQVSVGDQVEGQWGEEIMDPETRLAAIVAHLTQNSRNLHHHPQHKITSLRGDVESSVMLDGQMRLFNAQTLEQHSEPLVALPPPPPLAGARAGAGWFDAKSDTTLKSDSPLLDSDGQVLELATRQPSRKSLPHKKRISRKLKRNTGNCTPQQDIVLISCQEDGAQEEILPDSFAHPAQLAADPHHNITHEFVGAAQVRPVLLCACGAYFGEEQRSFYLHLRAHYEPPHPPHLAPDKMTDTCIDENVATLPDSIVELSLENTVPKTMYQTMDKHILYTSSEKPIQYSSNKLQYSMTSIDKEVPSSDVEKADLYESLDKLEIYNCIKCNKTFRKQKQCEAHIKEVHGKVEDMGEFSEPEDLMEGIHVAVDAEDVGADAADAGAEAAALEPYAPALPHLTVDRGTVRQDHVRHWELRAACPACPAGPACPAPHHLKEEVFQRIFEEVPTTDNSAFADNIITDTEVPEPAKEPEPEPEPEPENKLEKGKKPGKRFECPQCGRVFQHRNSLLYHVLSHAGKQHVCWECNKGFYTVGALKIHQRVHNGDRPYKCEECQREFRQWSDLKYHKVSLHSNQKHFKCEFCGKEFARKYSLSVHRRIHTGERNYKCEYCNKSFRASSYRLSHMRTHTGDKPFECTQCGKCFRVAGDLRRHALTHDKLRARCDKPPAKHVRDDDDKKTPKQKTDKKEKNPKKIAAASTTKLPILKSILDRKTPKAKKEVIKKVGAPNVTTNTIKEEQFKMNSEFTNNVEVFDTRDYKFKEVYVPKDDQLRQYEMEERLPDEKNFAVLKPMFSNDNETIEIEKIYANRTENTDGKMAVFTHVEKCKDYGDAVISNSQVTLSDIRHLDREVRDVRSDSLNGENIENGFLERLAALYNIPAV